MEKQFFLSLIPKRVKIIITTHFIIIISDLSFIFLKYQDIKWCTNNDMLLILGQYVRVMSMIKTTIRTVLLTSTSGITQTILLKGVGFKCSIENSVLLFKLGRSNIQRLKIPFNVLVKCISKNELNIIGTQLQSFQNFCQTVRLLRRPNVYKQIGIYFGNEIVILRKLLTKKESFT